MLTRILGGLVGAAITVMAVTLIVFVMVRLSGDPVRAMAPLDATPATLHAIRVSLGLSQPLFVQYFTFLGNILRGHFGTSIEYGLSVRALYASRAPATLELTGVAFGIATIMGLIGGLYAAHRPNRGFDYAARFLAALGQSVPPFVIGLLLILFFAVHLGVLPPSGDTSWKSVLLPAVTLSMASAAALIRLMRASALDVLTSDYITVARLKGLSETRVLWRHSLRNASLPVLTFGALLFINMLTGTIVIETVFNWPGIGLLMVQGIEARDYPVVQAGVVIFAIVYILVNLLVDVLYVVLNPELRRGG